MWSHSRKSADCTIVTNDAQPDVLALMPVACNTSHDWPPVSQEIAAFD